MLRSLNGSGKLHATVCMMLLELNQETGIYRFGFRYRVRKYFQDRVNGDTRNFSWGTWIPNLLFDLNVSSNTNKINAPVEC